MEADQSRGACHSLSGFEITYHRKYLLYWVSSLLASSRCADQFFRQFVEVGKKMWPVNLDFRVESPVEFRYSLPIQIQPVEATKYFVDLYTSAPVQVILRLVAVWVCVLIA